MAKNTADPIEKLELDQNSTEIQKIEESFEMIELMNAEFDTLARAFDLISAVCAEGLEDKDSLQDQKSTAPENLLH